MSCSLSEDVVKKTGFVWASRRWVCWSICMFCFPQVSQAVHSSSKESMPSADLYIFSLVGHYSVLLGDRAIYFKVHAEECIVSYHISCIMYHVSYLKKFMFIHHLHISYSLPDWVHHVINFCVIFIIYLVLCIYLNKKIKLRNRRRSSWEFTIRVFNCSEHILAYREFTQHICFPPLVRPNWRVVLVVWSLYNVCVVHKRAEGCIHLTEPSSTCLHRTGLHDALRFGCYFLWTVLLFPFPTCRGLEIWSGKCGFASLPLLPSIRWQDNNLQFLSAQVFLNVCVCVCFRVCVCACFANVWTARANLSIHLFACLSSCR